MAKAITERHEIVRFEAGERVEDIARAHNRSPKASQMRLDRLGLPQRS
jgi:hypothetical protein